jgi:hypothetical protein
VGAVKLTVAEIEPVALAVPIMGAPGVSIDVVIKFEADEADDVRVPL